MKSRKRIPTRLLAVDGCIRSLRLALTLPSTVTETLNLEFKAGFMGRDPSEIDFTKLLSIHGRIRGRRPTLQPIPPWVYSTWAT